MAQQVGYFEDNVTYREGPFVIVNANGFRIECEVKGHICPAFPHLSISRLKDQLGYPQGKTDRETAAAMCDRLNGMVREGKIELVGTMWIHRPTMGDLPDPVFIPKPD